MFPCFVFGIQTCCLSSLWVFLVKVHYDLNWPGTHGSPPALASGVLWLLMYSPCPAQSLLQEAFFCLGSGIVGSLKESENQAVYEIATHVRSLFLMGAMLPCSVWGQGRKSSFPLQQGQGTSWSHLQGCWISHCKVLAWAASLSQWETGRGKKSEVGLALLILFCC